VLLNLQDPNDLACQHQSWIRRSIVYDHNIERIAILSPCRWYESPVVRIAQAGQQRFGQSKRLKLWIVIKLRLAAARRFDNYAQITIITERGELEKISHNCLSVDHAIAVNCYPFRSPAGRPNITAKTVSAILAHHGQGLAAWRPFVRAFVAAASGMEVWRIHSWELPVVRLSILNGCVKEQFLDMVRDQCIAAFSLNQKMRHLADR
jgi:hypothetical protein